MRMRDRPNTVGEKAFSRLPPANAGRRWVDTGAILFARKGFPQARRLQLPSPRVVRHDCVHPKLLSGDEMRYRALLIPCIALALPVCVARPTEAQSVNRERVTITAGPNVHVSKAR